MSAVADVILVGVGAETHPHHTFLADLRDGFAAHGVAAEAFPLHLDGAGLAPFLDRVAAAGADTLLVDINGRMRLPQVRHMRRVLLLLDHPYQHAERIADLPAGGLVTYVDRGHRSVFGLLGTGHDTVFVPHGGPPPEGAPLPMRERDIDLLFVGRLERLPGLQALTEQLAESDPVVRTLAVETAEAALSGTPVHEALLDACGRHGVAPADLGRDGMLGLSRLLEHWVKAEGRRRLLMAVLDAGLPVTLVGTVREDFFDETPDGLTLLGSRSFAECRELMGRTRILMNSVSFFPRGSHERIWYGMAAGAVVATDPSDFVQADFNDGETILIWPEDAAAVAPMLERALADPQGLQAMAEAARPVYAAHHTWAERAGRILAAIRENQA